MIYLEDKVLQRAVVMLLEPMDETDFNKGSIFTLIIPGAVCYTVQR